MHETARRLNLSLNWVSLLSDSGWEALHWSAIGVSDAQDSVIMSYAATNDYVVLTHDLDFGSILAATHGRKPSVVQLRTEEVSPRKIGKLVAAALRLTEPDLEAGALLTIEPDRTRLRLLPLQSAD